MRAVDDEDAGVDDRWVALAQELADAAARVTTAYFRRPLAVEAKADDSPVTAADRAAEKAMRALVADRAPGHAVYGEEEGVDAAGDGEYVWVLDPIDGTKSFVTGKPLWGTLVALVRNGVPVVGVIDQPVTKERWVGVRGRPTTLNGEAISVRPCAALDDAFMYSTTPLMFEGAAKGAYDDLAGKVRVPLYGCDCYAYGLLAAGFCDLVVEADLKPYDFMALVPVVEGAGGTMTDWDGAPLRWWPYDDGSPGYAAGKADDTTTCEVCAAGDTLAHAQALEALAWAGRKPR